MVRLAVMVPAVMASALLVRRVASAPVAELARRRTLAPVVAGLAALDKALRSSP